MLQGFKRQVQGSNGSNPAQLGRPWGSTQTLPSRHNEAQRLRQDGHAVIKAWGIAHIPGVVSREDRIRLSSEKGLNIESWQKQPQSLGQLGKDKIVSPEKKHHNHKARARTTINNGMGSTTTIVANTEDHKYPRPLARRQSGELYRIYSRFDTRCNSWSSSHGTRSNLVPQRYG